MTFGLVQTGTILAMAAITLILRFSGYLLVRYVHIQGRTAAAMQAMPAAVLTALVVPTALATGPAETIAAVVTILIVLKYPLIVAVFGGTLAVVGLRALFA